MYQVMIQLWDNPSSEWGDPYSWDILIEYLEDSCFWNPEYVVKWWIKRVD